MYSWLVLETNFFSETASSEGVIHVGKCKATFHTGAVGAGPYTSSIVFLYGVYCAFVLYQVYMIIIFLLTDVFYSP